MNLKKGITKLKELCKMGKEKAIKHKKVTIGLGVGIFAITTALVVYCARDKVVLTIDDVKYTESDFNMYAYLTKHKYFGVDGTQLSEDTLNTQVSSNSNMTIGEYLKDQTINKIKISASILRIAEENNISLSSDDLNEIQIEKNEFIESLGGKSEYRKMLRKNNTTDDAYIEVAKVNKLYDIIFDCVYEEGKINDLSQQELEEAKSTYEDDYVKIKQIILLKKDLGTNQYLDEKTINQKYALAQDLVNKARNGENFDELIEKYSEDTAEEIASQYYLKSTLVDELMSEIDSLNNGDISEVVSTKYAYHVVIKEELDEVKLEEYYDSKREEKFAEDVAENFSKLVVLNDDYLEKIKVM